MNSKIFSRVSKLTSNTIKRVTNVGVSIIDNNSDVLDTAGVQLDGILDDAGSFANSFYEDGKAIGKDIIDNGKKLLERKTPVKKVEDEVTEQEPNHYQS
jgi:hypothetical protein